MLRPLQSDAQCTTQAPSLVVAVSIGQGLTPLAIRYVLLLSHLCSLSSADFSIRFSRNLGPRSIRQPNSPLRALLPSSHRQILLPESLQRALLLTLALELRLRLSNGLLRLLLRGRI